MRPFDLALAEIGTNEYGKGHNPKILAYFKDAGASYVTDDETAWCTAFVGAMLKRSGRRGTGKLNARSYLDYSIIVKLADAQEGDIVIFKRGNSTWQGHVGFFVKDAGLFIEVLGGNQGNSVSKKRYKKSDLLGVRQIPPLTKDVTLLRKPTQLFSRIVYDKEKEKPTILQRLKQWFKGE